MDSSRRNFLKAVGCGGALALAGQSSEAEARPNLTPPAGAVGMLYDSTLCIGCKACVVSCRQANDTRPEVQGEHPIWDMPLDKSSRTLNVIKVYKQGDGSVKDREQNGFAFTKRHCMHCVDAGCVSACPVSAMRKDPVTGIVTHHPDACIGCRYCVYACPYNVPKYEIDKADGQIQKCQLCKHRLADGQLPACVEVCPTGASLYGTHQALLAEARHRLTLKPGEMYTYPRGALGVSDRQIQPREGHVRAAPQYVQHILGEKEGGGTQVMHLAAVSFPKLGIPILPERSYASMSESIQHTLYKGMIAPALLLGGLLYTVRRNTRDDDHHDGPK